MPEICVRCGRPDSQPAVARAIGDGANGWNRTSDRRFTKPLLYR